MISGKGSDAHLSFAIEKGGITHLTRQGISPGRSEGFSMDQPVSP